MLSAWHRLFRTEHALITFIGVAAGAFLAVGSSTDKFLPGFLIFLAVSALGPALITLAAFALNDYFGYETDRVNKRKDRPIVSGEIKRNHALYAALTLFALGLIATYFVNFTVFLLSLLYVVLCFAYDTFLKKLPLLGNVFIALTMAGPLVYGNLAVYASLSSTVVLLAVIAFLVGLGRELLNTLRDVQGDKKIGATTLPMLLGGKNTVLLSSLFIIAAVLLSFVPLSSAPFLYVVPLIPCDFLLLLTVYKVLKSQDNVTLKQCRNYTLFALVFGVVAFLSLAVL